MTTTAKEHEPKHEAKHERGEAKDAVEPFGTIQASASNADGATTTTSATTFAGGGDIITAQCTNGATPPTQGCMVILLLSADNVTYYRVASHRFGMGASGVYFHAFDLADHAGTPDRYGLTLPWLWFKLQFTGNIGAAVTIAATNAGT